MKNIRNEAAALECSSLPKGRGEPAVIQVSVMCRGNPAEDVVPAPTILCPPQQL